MTFKRILALAALLFAVSVAVPRASQNDLVLPLSGIYSGVQYAGLMNDALDSLVTCNSGSNAPTNAGGTAKKGQCWVDTSTTPNIKKIYDGTQWIVEGYLDASNAVWTPPIGGGTNTLASATTTDLCSVPQSYVSISGTTAITSFSDTCAKGVIKVLNFVAALTLTYDATAMVLPSAASITTAAGDKAIFVHLGSGAWQALSYSRAAGTALVESSVGVGTIQPTSRTTPTSNKYQFAYGQAVSRTTYADLLAATTLSASGVTRNSGSPSFGGFSSIEQYAVGTPCEGTGIQAGSVIVSIGTLTITLDKNATSTGTGTIQCFPNGSGDGSTTFNVIDMRGRNALGRDNMGGSSAGLITSAGSGCSGGSLGVACGSQTVTLSTSNLPSHSHTFSGTTSSDSAGTPSGSGFVGTGSNTVTTGGGTNVMAFDGTTLAAGLNASGPMSAHSHTYSGTTSSVGTGTAISLLSPTKIINYEVRVLP